MRLKVLFGLLAILAAGCVAEAFSGGGSRGKPCRHGDRRCKNSSAAPQYALQVFWGGVDAGQVGGGTVSTQSGTALTVARSSATQCGDTSGGFSNQVASNTACTELQGLAIRPTTTNILPHTNSWADWTQDTATFTTGQLCPDGTTSGVLMTDTVANGGHRVYKGLSGTVGGYTESLYAKLGPNSTSGVLELWVGGNSEQAVFDVANCVPSIVTHDFSGSSSLNLSINAVPVNGFCWMSFSTTDVTNAGFFQIHMGKTYLEATGSYVGGDAGIILCNPMTTNPASGIQSIRPYVVNDGGTTATRAADLVSVANPLAGSTFVLGVSATPDNGKWDQFDERGLISLGWDAGADSNTLKWFVSDGGFQTAVLVDNAGGVKTVVSNTISWPGRHYLQFQVDGGGTMALYQDGLLLSSTTSGAGSGVIGTQPSTVFIGSEGVFANQLGGIAEDICGDPTLTGCAIAYTKALSAPKKNLVALGDSLTNNTLNVNYWPARLHQSIPSWTANNLGVPTWQIADIWATYQDAGYPQAQVISIEDGINDISTLTYASTTVLEGWIKWVWDGIASQPGSPSLLVLRESPWAYSIAWGAAAQTRYDTLQTWVASEAALYGYPYVDLYRGTLWDAGTSPPALLCQYDYDTDGVTNVCLDWPNTKNAVHYNDAGSFAMYSQIVDGGFFPP